ncbi:reverse transcriptase domain-containing protein [Tanacetum coccineum]
MAAPGGANQIARRVIDDLIKFSGETSVDGYMSFFKSHQIAESYGFINRMREEANTTRNLVGHLNALIAKMEALEDQGDVFDTLMDLRDDREAARTKLQGLDELITQAVHEIETKEAQIQAMNEMIDNDKWKWHNERKDVFPELISILVPSCSIHKDKAVWRCNNGSLKDYSTYQVWEDYKVHHPKVDWRSLVWFSQNIPSHAFVLWMAIQKRLMTQDRIYQWNKDNSMKCSLCSSCMDSHDHLFFQCSFSYAIWVIVKGKSYIDNLKSNCDDSVSSMALFNKNATKDIIRRLVFGALVYYIWQERNKGQFSNEKRFVVIIADIILENVKLKLMSLSVLNSVNVQRGCLGQDLFLLFGLSIGCLSLQTMAELSSLYIGVLLFERYGSILNILQGRNELLENIIGCVVDSGGVPELDPKDSKKHRALLFEFFRRPVREHLGYVKIVSWKKARSVGDKLKETEDKIKEGTLKFDHGTDAMTVVLGKEKGGYARGVGSRVTYNRYFNLPRSRQASDERIALFQSQLDNERRERQEKELEIQNLSNKMSQTEGMVSSVDINPIDSSADEEGGTPVVGCENDASIQKSNGLATLEKEMGTRASKCKLWHLKKSTIIALDTVYETDGKKMLHNKELLKDCYKVSIDKSLGMCGLS